MTYYSRFNAVWTHSWNFNRQSKTYIFSPAITPFLTWKMETLKRNKIHTKRVRRAWLNGAIHNELIMFHDVRIEFFHREV